MKYLILLTLIAATSLCYAVPSFQKQYQDYLKSSLCAREQIALKVERSQIVIVNDKCFVK